MQSGTLNTASYNGSQCAPSPRVLEEQVRSLMDAIPESCTVIVITAISVVALLWNANRGVALTVWLMCVLAVQGSRFLLERSYRRDSGRRESLGWAELVAGNSLLSGSLWGVGGGMVFATSTIPLEQVFVAILLMGLGAGAITVTVAFLWAYRAFIMPATMPLVVAGAWQSFVHTETARGLYGLMAALFAIYLIFISRLAKQLNGRLIESFEKRFLVEKLNAELEEQRVALQEARAAAEEANDLKTFLMKFASHDIGNGLLSIGAIVRESKLGTIDPETESLLLAHLVATKNFVEDIRHITNIKEKALVPKPTSIELPILLAKVRGALLPLALHRRVALNLNPQSVWVKSEGWMLDRIIYNVTLNAIQNTREGGSVTIGSRFATEMGAESLIWVEVEDTGIGMSEDQIPDLRPGRPLFARAVEPRDDREHLGLRIVAGFAHALHHPAVILSELGKGSRFRISLRQTPAPTPADGILTEQELQHSAKGLFIGLIDDDPFYLGEVAARLNSFGCRVEASLSGEDAEIALATHDRTPDLLICDYHLGRGVTGLEVAAAIHARLGRAVPLIIISADDHESLRQGVQAGGAEFHKKPLDFEHLRQRIIALTAA